MEGPGRDSEVGGWGLVSRDWSEGGGVPSFGLLSRGRILRFLRIAVGVRACGVFACGFGIWGCGGFGWGRCFLVRWGASGGWGSPLSGAVGGSILAVPGSGTPPGPLNTLNYLWYYHKKFWRSVDKTWISRGTVALTHSSIEPNLAIIIHIVNSTNSHFKFSCSMPHSNYEYAMLVLHVYFTVDLYWCFTIFDPGELPSMGGMGLGFGLPQVTCPPLPHPRSLKNQCHNQHIFTCFFNRFSLTV